MRDAPLKTCWNAKMSVDRIAAAIGRHRSTVFHEIKRNKFVDDELPNLNGYYAMAAQHQTGNRRARQRKLIRHDRLRITVEERLKSGWTPEQVAGRMRLENAMPRACQALPGRVSRRECPERRTIYRHIYSRDGKRAELWWHLPNHRMSRRSRPARKRRASNFAREVSILFRPEAVAHRTEFGHWEGDLVLFQQRLAKRT